MVEDAAGAAGAGAALGPTGIAMAVGGQVVGSVVSGLFGRSVRRAQRRLMRQQRKALKQQMELQMEGFELMKGEMDIWRDRLAETEAKYAPIENEIISDARRGVDIGGMTGRAAQDVDQVFGAQREQQRRDLMSYGIDPSSGRYVSSDRMAGLEQAKASALAQNQSRLRGQDQNRALRQNAMKMGLNRIGMANQNFTNFAGATGNMITGAANVAGQQAQQYGQQADQHARLSENLFSNAAQLGLGAIDTWMKNKPSSNIAVTPMDSGLNITGKTTVPNVNIPGTQGGGGMGVNL